MTLKLLWVGLFLTAVVVVGLSISSVLKKDALKEAEAIYSPVDNSLMLQPEQIANKNWHFKHCTPTNQKCGRLE